MTHSDTPRALPIQPQPRRPTGFSLIWLIPILAILAAVGVAYQNWSSRGPLIEVEFGQADGVHAHETELRYRDIAVGVVEEVHFSDDLNTVIAGIRLDKDMAHYVDADAAFWIVRPEVTAQGVSGLDTVLSGVYIAGAWDGVPGEAQHRFTGAEDAPLLALGEEGVTITLRSEESLPAEGTPMLYRGVQVGRMGRSEVSEDGLTVSAPAVILEPYTDLVTSSTRFWDISGFSFSINGQGASLDFSSLASLISGGVTFETLASGGTPLVDGAEFTLHPDEETAREDFFLEGEGGSIDVMMVFEENLSGLTAGAPVTLGGLRIGEVVAIAGMVDAARFGDDEVRLVATLKLNPGRLGLEVADDSEEAFLDYLASRVEQGMRGRLTNASLLTGGLKVELVVQPGAAPATLDRNGDPYPQIPTAAADVANIAASAQGILSRVDALPVEEVMDQVIGFLEDARGVIGSEEVQQVPESILATLEAVRRVADSPEVAALPSQVGELTENLTEASGTLNTLLTQVQDKAVVDAVSELIASLDETAETLPDLSGQAADVLGKVEALPLEGLSAQLSALLGDADALITDPELTAIPADLRATLQRARDLLDSPEVVALPAQVGELAENLTAASDKLNGLLEEAQQEQIIQAVSNVVASLKTTTDRLPGIADQASNVLSDAEELSLDELADQARTLMASIDALVDQDSTRELPSELNTALAELRLTMEELRRGGVVDNVNGTLAAARRAAESISEASRSLPDLANRLTVVATQAGVTLAGYDRQSDFGRELSTAIRSIEEAADSIDRLARQIARNPNSLLTGR
jgi:paraquat-inducible protein B